MPLVKPDYYTLQESLDLIRGALPDEDALGNLRQFLHSRPGAAWIINGDDGRRVEIPHNLWLSFPPKYHPELLELSVERGTAKFQDLSGNPYGPWRFPVVEGPIQIDRGQLDELLRACKPPSQIISFRNEEIKCEKWLKQEIRDDKRRHFEECQTEAIQRFNISKIGFRRVWKKTVPQEWKHAGAPRKTSQ